MVEIKIADLFSARERSEIGTHLISMMASMKDVYERSVTVRRLLNEKGIDFLEPLTAGHGFAITQHIAIPTDHSLLAYTHGDRLKAVERLAVHGLLTKVDEDFYTFPNGITIDKEEAIDNKLAKEVLSDFEIMSNAGILALCEHELLGKCFVYKGEDKGTDTCCYAITKDILVNSLRLGVSSADIYGIKIGEGKLEQFLH